MRISDWSSDVCSSDLPQDDRHQAGGRQRPGDADQEALVEQDRRRAGATGQRRSTGLEALLTLSCGHAATEQIGRVLGDRHLPSRGQALLAPAAVISAAALESWPHTGGWARRARAASTPMPGPRSATGPGHVTPATAR